MDKWKGRVALVTGAASGIGKATTLRLLDLGMTVAACDKDEVALKSIKTQLEAQNASMACRLHVFHCDVSRESDIYGMFGKITDSALLQGVDVCVNSAGVSHQASLLDGEVSQFREMFDVNLMGYLICARESIRSMNTKGVDDGHVLFMGSTKGHRVRTGKPEHSDYNFYNATKFAIRALVEGLRNELRMRGSHIRVTLLSPGLVRTDLTYRMYPDAHERVDALYNDVTPLEADDVADAVVYALSCPSHVQVHDMLLLATEQS